MPTLSFYCKAYPIERFEQYPHWQPHVSSPSEEASNQSSEELSGPGYYFLHENLSVTKGVFSDQDVIFQATDPEWEEFCRKKLGFAVPERSKLSIPNE